jgi:hypothetical protein
VTMSQLMRSVSGASRLPSLGPAGGKKLIAPYAHTDTLPCTKRSVFIVHEDGSELFTLLGTARQGGQTFSRHCWQRLTAQLSQGTGARPTAVQVQFRCRPAAAGNRTP